MAFYRPQCFQQSSSLKDYLKNESSICTAKFVSSANQELRIWWHQYREILLCCTGLTGENKNSSSKSSPCIALRREKSCKSSIRHCITGITATGFSISFGVDGLDIKVGDRRSKFHRGVWGHAPTHPPPQKNSKSRRSDVPFHSFWQAVLY